MVVRREEHEGDARIRTQRERHRAHGAPSPCEAAARPAKKPSVQRENPYGVASQRFRCHGSQRVAYPRRAGVDADVQQHDRAVRRIERLTEAPGSSASPSRYTPPTMVSHLSQSALENTTAPQREPTARAKHRGSRAGRAVGARIAREFTDGSGSERPVHRLRVVLPSVGPDGEDHPSPLYFTVLWLGLRGSSSALPPQRSNGLGDRGQQNAACRGNGCEGPHSPAGELVRIAPDHPVFRIES